MPYHGKILIVDDEPLMCESLKELLCAQGYEPTTCHNGGDALACLTGETVDLILLDIGMADMDGFQVMEKMGYQNIDTPVIMMTGDASTSSAVKALRKGAYDYLRKPFDPEELFTSVKNALNLRRLKRDNHRIKRELSDSAERFGTDRKRAEMALRASREKYHSLYAMMRRLCDNVPDMIWAKDLEKRFVFVNNAMCRDLLNAVDATEPIGKTDMFFAMRERANHTENPEWHTFGEICCDSDAVVMDTGKAQRFDEFGNVKGKFLFLDVYKAPFLDENGKMMGTVGCARDVTDAKEAQEALRIEHWRLESIIEGTHVGTWEWNIQTGEVVLNAIWVEMVGYTLDELSPVSIKTWEGLTAPDDLRQSRELLNRHFAGELPYYDSECRMKHKDGHWVWVHDRGRVTTRSNDGRPLMMFGTHSDITERKRAEEEREEIEAQNRQLQKAESLSRMAGAIAHHFNNQLAAVIGNLDLAMEDLPPGQKPLENLTEAMKAARRATEVSSRMLTYLGQTSAQTEALDICEVCRQGLPLLRAILPKRILLTTDFVFPGPVLSGNTSQLQQMLTHLVTNAQEAIGEGIGAIELNVRTFFAAEIPPAFCFPIGWQPRDNAYACLEVADSGCGIADKDIEKIFDPFFTSKFTGRGLGLAVVSGIVKAHRGAITVKSGSGRGSIFRIFLPVSSKAVIHPQGETAGLPEFKGSGTVLLVEDEEMVRKMSKTMLTRLGFTVLEARDGIEAVEIFRWHRDEIRCVLCDLTMPRMNGWDTLTALRTLCSHLPVILTSGHDEGRVMAQDHPDRPDVFLHKPFHRKDLAAAIQRVLIQK